MSENRVKVNGGRFSLEVPEGFHLVGEEEAKEIGGKVNKNSWAIRDSERHLIFESAWKDIPFFAKKTELKKIIENTEKQFRVKVPEYRKELDISRIVAGEDALGFEYSYHVMDIDMVAEYILLKHGKQYYAFDIMGRMKTFDDFYPVLDGILRSVKFED